MTKYHHSIHDTQHHTKPPFSHLMDDKRTAESASLPSTPGADSKRARVTTRPITLEDVADFQKEAIFRAMENYRREKELLEARVATQTKRERQMQLRLVALSSWWDKLLDRVALTAGGYHFKAAPKVEAEAEAEAEADAAEDAEDADDETEPETPQPTGLPSDLELEEKATAIKDSITPLLDVISSHIQSQDHTETAKLAAGYAEMSVQHRALVSKISELEKLVTNTTSSYLSACKQLDRLKSPTVKLIEPEDVEEEPKQVKKENKETNSAAKDESAVSEGDSAALKTLRAAAEVQETQMKELDAKISSLEHDASLFAAKMADLGEVDLAEHSAVFRALRAKSDELRMSVSALESSRDAALAEKRLLEDNRGQYRQTLKREFEKRENDTRNQLTRTEADLVRIRTVRDEILAELNQKKAVESDKIKTIESLKELGDIQEQRIKTLEAEVKRWRQEGAENESSDGVAEIGDDIEALKKKIANLDATNKSLMAEIPGMETAFTKAQSMATTKALEVSDRESKLHKLLAEKARADEKYFAAMRHKDALQTENSKLQAQMVKSSELVNSLQELDNKTRLKIDVLEKTLADYVSLQGKQQLAIKHLTGQVSEKSLMLEGAQKYVSKLKEEMKHSITKLEVEQHSKRKMVAENARLTKQVELASFGTKDGASDEVDELRSIAMCSLCSKNWKDTALKVCGHVFCHQCAQDRLDARLRKCPNCNKPFSQNDLLTVHL